MIPFLGLFNYLILALLFLIQITKSLKVGIHDLELCKKTNASLSCLHQLPESIQPFSSCQVEFVPPINCLPYEIDQSYNPFNLPFNLNLYQFRDRHHHYLSFNISFPSPEWNSMAFHIQNQLNPELHLCRKINFRRNTDSRAHPFSLFWDCVLFNVNAFEGQSFSLFLQDDQQFGGTYSFRTPLMKYFNSTTSISDWQVFFFLHTSYAEITDKQFVTIQLAPFSVVSYAVSSVKCLSDGNTCENRTVVDTVILNATDFSDLTEGESFITSRIVRPTEPGVYAVTVKILSDECDESDCAVSISPIFGINRSINWPTTIVCTIIGLLSIFSITIFIVIRLFLKIHNNFKNYLTEKLNSPDSVHIVYHAHSQEYLEFIRYLSYVLKCKISTHPLIVDDDAGTANPNDWTRAQLSNSAKVIFIVPDTMNMDSTTPIQHQWLCALKYFSGSYFRKEGSISTKYATVILPISIPVEKGSEIYSLPRFNLPYDLAALSNWLHRSRFLDKYVFWPLVTKNEIKTMSSFINYTNQPSLYPKPDVGDIARTPTRIIMSGLDENSTHSSQACLDEDDNILIEKVQKEFDPLIPDIRHMDDDSEDDERTVDNDTISSSESCSVNSDDILNFVD